MLGAVRGSMGIDSRPMRTRIMQAQQSDGRRGFPTYAAVMVAGLLCAGAALGIAPAMAPAAEVAVAATDTVTAVVQPNSTWSSGWCGAIAVRNDGSRAVSPATVSFTLPAGATVRNVWNAEAATSGTRVTLGLPGGAHAPPAGAYSASGFCLTGSPAPPTAPGFTLAEGGAAVAAAPAPGTASTPVDGTAPTASPTPTATAAETPSSTAVPTPPPPFTAVATPLSTQGSSIVDAEGRPIVLQGVNWFGFETHNHAPHGLWSRDYKDMLAQIKSLGFNTIRLPFSLEALQSTSTTGIEYSNGRNAELAGRTPQEVMDIIIDEAGRQGLMIILDNHSQTDDGFMDDLWFGQGGFSEADWVAAWEALASRYADRPNVVAADLKNEPHGSATWGTGSATDWRRAAELAGNAVLAKAPDWLIIVEGIENKVAGGQQLNSHWWGGNLEGVRANPVRLSTPGRVVYSPHEYGPGVHAQPWFSSPQMASILADRWNKGFGYISDGGTAPILVGEFGGRDVGLDTVEGRWMRQFADYLGQHGTSWTFWSWNPNSGDTGGVLADDWKTVNADKMALLTSLQKRERIDFGGITDASSPPASSSTSAAATPAPPPATEPATESDPAPTSVAAPPAQSAGGLQVSVRPESSWDTGGCRATKVKNVTKAPIGNWTLTFTLAPGTTMTSSWNGTAAVAGASVTVTPPAWAAQVAPGQEVAVFGFCFSGGGEPTDVRATPVG